MKTKLTYIHNRITWLELPLLAIWVFLMDIFIAPGSFLHTIDWMTQNPLLILLNLLPVAVLLLIIYFICGNTFIAGGITNLFFGLMSYVNLLKIDGRDDPFVPADIALLREAMKATGDYRLDMHFGIVALILISTAMFLALGIYLGKAEKRAAAPRIIGAVLCAAVFLGAFFTLYRSKEIYNSFPVSIDYNVTTAFDELGFNYCFLYNFNLYAVDKPEGYSEAEAEAYDDAFHYREQTRQPQILMIMCEAFTDLTADEAFSYSPEEQPLKNYFAVRDSENCISGRIVVPNFGAGTANTEFDVISGMQTNMISDTSNSALRTFHKNIPTVATALSSCGYDTFYFHQGTSWFYNRNSALNFMGIDSLRFDEGETWTDDVFLSELKSELESRTENGEKLFTYATTIQNHQAYVYGKYDFELPKVSANTALSAEAEEWLSVYAYGLKCSSDMLLELTEYLNTLTEPYILVFFGDHQPNLGADFQAYRELGIDVGGAGTPQQLVDTCSVPFIIWGNDAYLSGSTMADRAEGLDLPADGRISACFLGEIALELADGSGLDPYFAYLGELRRCCPVIKMGIAGYPDGSLTANPDAETLGLIQKMHNWQYYRLVSQIID